MPEPSTCSGEEFLEHLLAPVRTGFILTRSDLIACADALGLAVRAGERRYVLKALLGQEAAPVLDWLARLAADAAAGHAVRDGIIAEFWAARARAASELLAAAAADA